MVNVQIRHTHPYGFRMGEWATIADIRWFNFRPCYHVVFPDGVEDDWAIRDSMDPYEFRAEVVDEKTAISK